MKPTNILSILALTVIQSLAQSIYEPYTFITLAGNGSFGSADGTGSAAAFWNSYGVAVDSAGNVYVADRDNDTIRRVTPAGVVTTLAGLAGSIGSADGTGSTARFYKPTGVAVDSAGNVYVTDNGNSTIRKVTPAGEVTTLAGAAGGFGSVDGTGSAARFGNIYSVAVDNAGNVYVADRDNDTIRKVTPEGLVTTLAGLVGSDGSADGTGSAARFTLPRGVALDSAGNVYVADTGNQTIRKGLPPVGPPVILTQPQSQTIEGAYNVNFSVIVAGALPLAYQWRKDGVDLAGATNTSYSIANLRTNDAGVYSVVSTNLFGGGVSSNATLTVFVRPPLISAHPQSQTVVAGYDVIFSVEADGTPLLAYQWRKDGVDIAGATDPSYSIANIQNHDAGFYRVVVSNPYGSVTSSDAELSVTISYAFTTFAEEADGYADGTGTAAEFNFPTGVAVDSAGNVYVTDGGNYTIRKITAGGVVSTLAGLAGSYGSADGTGNAARFGKAYGTGPFGLAVDSAGNVYVADTGNHTIRKVTPSGVVSTLAGRYGSTGLPFSYWFESYDAGPFGVAVDSAGNVYVADTGNHTIGKITPDGMLSTLAGLPGSRGTDDGTGSAARFYIPIGVAVDGVGNVYVTDYNSIRKVTPAGVVTTLAGPRAGWAISLGGVAVSGGSADGTGSAARFRSPSGVAVDSSGNVYVADATNHKIRKGHPALLILNSGPGFGFNVGQFEFNLTGPAGRSVIVEVSTDLVSWLPIWTNTFAGALSFRDSQSGAYSNRFYRAHLR